MTEQEFLNALAKLAWEYEEANRYNIIIGLLVEVPIANTDIVNRYQFNGSNMNPIDKDYEFDIVRKIEDL